MLKDNRHSEFFKLILFQIAFLFLIFIIGCSGGKNNITSPSTDLSQFKLEARDGVVKSGMLPIAVFDLAISSDLSSAEITPVRFSDALGDSWFSVLTNFFKASPCRDCLDVRSITINADGNVVLTIYARHPFAKGNPSLPPDARNRDDLRVFDTKLIVVTKDNAGPSFDDFGVRLSSTIVANADGYTDMIDPVYDFLGNKEDNTHPYIILFENPNEGNVDPASSTGFGDLSNASGHNVMNQDTSSLNDLELNIEPGQSHQFKLFLTANYGLSAENYLQRLTPRYYLPEFNSKEAWKVEATVESSSLGPTFTTSMAEVLVQIWDWQHNATVDPNLTFLDTIRAPSGIKSVDIIAPGLFTGIVSQTKADPIGNGRGDEPLEYHLEVYNELGAGAGVFPALVRVVDERNIGGNQSIPEDGIDNNGFNLDPFDVPGFRTYDYIEFLLTVFWNNNPIARFTLSPGSEPLVIGLNEDFNYDATASYDVDGGISTYEWDFDYDRETFDPEPGHDSATGTFRYSSTGLHRIALRVKDNTVPMMTDITYKYAIVLPEQQNIAPRRVCPAGLNCDNLRFSAKRAIKTHGNKAYIALGGTPLGHRYMISSTDYGANFNTPVKVHQTILIPATQHIGGFDISSTGQIGYVYFDENTTAQSAWFLLNRSTDGLTWNNQESLEYSTLNDYANDANIIYGANDREFIIFNMLAKSITWNFSALYYVYRLHPPQMFQSPPLPLVLNAAPPSEIQFFQPQAAVGPDGQVHVAFNVMTQISGNDRYSVNYTRLAADGSGRNRDPIKISRTDYYNAEKELDIAVDGQKVYVAFVEWDTMSQREWVELVVSEDSGQNWWTQPVVITDDAIYQIANNHPVSIVVDDNHRLHVVWAHNKNQLIPEYRDIWYDYSDDGGHTFHTDQHIYGEGVAADQSFPSVTMDELGRVHVVWWNDDETAGRGVWHTRFKG